METRGAARAAPDVAAALAVDAASQTAGPVVRDAGDAAGRGLAGVRAAVGDVEAALHRGAGWVEAGARGAVADLAERAAEPPSLRWDFAIRCAIPPSVSVPLPWVR